MKLSSIFNKTSPSHLALLLAGAVAGAASATGADLVMQMFAQVAPPCRHLLLTIPPALTTTMIVRDEGDMAPIAYKGLFAATIGFSFKAMHIALTM